MPEVPITPGAYSLDGKVFVQETKAKKSLVALGVLLIVLFLAGLVLTRTVGNVQKVVGAATTTSTGTAAGTSATTTTTTTKSFVSDTVLTAILSTGVFILLIGLLYARITAIKLPGGGEIDLGPMEDHLLRSKVKETIDKTPNLGNQDVGSLFVEARHLAVAQKLETGVPFLSEDDLSQVVHEATVAYTKS
ncbi:MAG TPA: hypothetical protein VIE38_09335 [Gaiellaceae bacterium]